MEELKLSERMQKFVDEQLFFRDDDVIVESFIEEVIALEEKLEKLDKKEK